MSHRALLLHVRGLVQGVGFRPFVHRLARRHGLGGWVRNALGEVEIELEGPTASLDAFMTALRREAPPLARVERVDVEIRGPSGMSGFRILQSSVDPGRSLPVAPDVATCDACLAELFDPSNRRYRYPFITCSDCGPRYTVIDGMPYDRGRTSMHEFEQCPVCLGEYEAPGNRRFHSESNSCPACGPRLWLETPGSTGLEGAAALAEAARRILAGSIVALRGLGGFHLAADATNAAAVARLRERKHRDAKPFAVMVRTLDDVLALGLPEAAARTALLAPERPVVLIERHADTPLAGEVAPGLSTVGVMLPYTPLHHLLLDLVRRPLVMTSGNRSDEPIAASNDDARNRLTGIADAFLLHNRHIVARCDDSVARVTTAGPVLLRRARGLAPMPVDLPFASPFPLLAVGAQLKSAFALVQGGRAWISPHLGDLDDADVHEHYVGTLRHYRALFGVEPKVVVRDLHPDYASTRLADDLGISRAVAVQHHHAHIAAVLAEHGETGPAVGIAFDGAGLGEDGATWGAEFLVADLASYRRAGQLTYAALPGGDLAARRPWRAALGYLSADPSFTPATHPAFADLDQKEVRLAHQQVLHRLNAPVTSSMGRLFDAAAAILGVRTVASFEGQAAMELESLASRETTIELPFPATEHEGYWTMNPLPLLNALSEQRSRGAAIGDLAAAFHGAVARTTAVVATRIAETRGLTLVALGGGVFQNARLLEGVNRYLSTSGLRVLTARRLPPNDGGLCYGQAAVAIAQVMRKQGD